MELQLAEDEDGAERDPNNEGLVDHDEMVQARLTDEDGDRFWIMMITHQQQQGTPQETQTTPKRRARMVPSARASTPLDTVGWPRC